MPLPEHFRDRVLPTQPKQAGPVWAGPAGEGPQGGVTQGLVAKWLVCRERFRLYTMQGLAVGDTFNHRLEFGSMWHLCEEAMASEVRHFGEYVGTTLWEDMLRQYSAELCVRYPFQRDDIDKWYRVCATQFPIYLNFWSKHKDQTSRTTLLSEEKFDLPYQLPSGRTVRLRGKWDEVDLCNNEVWLWENKTKGDVDERKIKRQLSFDLQTMFYLNALDQFRELYAGAMIKNAPIVGVRYNVVRRPLSGGKGTIVRHKPSKSNPMGESEESYYARIAQYIKDEPETYFMRWDCHVREADCIAFRLDCLYPVLENMLDDYEWWAYCARCPQVGVMDYLFRVQQFPHHANRHYRMPFGVYSPLMDGGKTDLDEHLETGSTAGLRVVNDVFPELKERA